MNYQEFPLEALPDALADYCVEIAESYGVDLSMVACSMLAIIAGVIGSTRKVQLKEGHQEPAIVWVLIVAKSGYGKSPVLKLLVKPLQDQEAEWYFEYLEEQKKYDEMDKEEKEFKSAPKKKTLTVSDFTLEALVKILSMNPDGIVIFRDEIAALFDSLGKYNNARGADQAALLEIFDGGPVKVDRKDDSKSVYAPKAFASIVGGIQPSVFEKTFRAVDWGSGLLPRFMIVKVDSEPQGYSLKVIDSLKELGYMDLIFKLFQLRSQKTKIITFDDEALQLYAKWCDDTIRPKYKGASEAMSAILTKLKTYAARIALVLQCCENPNAKYIKARIMKNSIQIITWFLASAEQFQHEASKADEAEILRLIREHGGFITPRDFYRYKRGYKNVGQARRRLLDLLRVGKLSILYIDRNFGFELIG